jgi:hypothetical protein
MKEENVDEGGFKTTALDTMSLSYPFFSPEFENNPENKLKKKPSARIQRPAKVTMRSPFGGENAAFFNTAPTVHVPLHSPSVSEPAPSPQRPDLPHALQGMIFSTCETNVFALSSEPIKTQETHLPQPQAHVEHVLAQMNAQVNSQANTSVASTQGGNEEPKPEAISPLSPLSHTIPQPERAHSNGYENGHSIRHGKRGHGLSHRQDARSKSTTSPQMRDDQVNDVRTAQERLHAFREKHSIKTPPSELTHSKLTVVTPIIAQPAATEPPLDERIVRLENMLAQLLEEAAAKKKEKHTSQALPFSTFATGIKAKKTDTLEVSKSVAFSKPSFEKPAHHKAEEAQSENRVYHHEIAKPNEMATPEKPLSLAQHVAPTLLSNEALPHPIGATTLSALLNNRFPNLNLKSTAALPSTPSLEASSAHAMHDASRGARIPLFSLASSARRALDAIGDALTLKSITALFRKAVAGLGHMVRPRVLGASVVGLALFILMIYMASAPSSARSAAKPQSFDLWVTDVFSPLRRALNAPG